MFRTLRVFACAAPLLCSTVAQATPVIDQQNWPADLATYDFFGLEADWPDYAAQIQHAQTFVVAHTGTLVGLDVLGNGSYPMTLEVRGQSNGHPDDTVLQTVAVPGFAGLWAATTIALDVPVTAGDLLSFVISGGSGGLWGNSLFGNLDHYANGSMWSGQNPPWGFDGPGSWYASGNDSGHEGDFLFRTVVDTAGPASVPEPATPALVLPALALMAFASARRSRR